MSLMYEIRKDPVIGRWVIVAKDSVKSVSEYIVETDISDNPDACPFCGGRDSNSPSETTAIKKAGSKSDAAECFTRVVPAVESMLMADGDLNRQGIGMYDKMDGIGRSEVIIESPEHFSASGDAGVEHTRKVLQTYKDRILALEGDSRLRYILISKSYRKAAGAVYSHPHSCLIATPIIPQRVKQELDGAKLYYVLKERCIFCDITREEERMKERIIFDNKNFVVFCPFAPAFPFEIWIMPRKHRCAFQDCDEGETGDLAAAIVEILGRLKRLLNDPPYNLILHTAPVMIPRRSHWQTLTEDFHWHIEIVPRLGGAKNFEWSSGFYILNISPEEGAKHLREVKS